MRFDCFWSVAYYDERRTWIPAFTPARQSASARRRGNDEELWDDEKMKNEGLDSRFTMPDNSGQRKSDFSNSRLKRKRPYFSIFLHPPVPLDLARYILFR